MFMYVYVCSSCHDGEEITQKQLKRLTQRTFYSMRTCVKMSSVYVINGNILI